jgi:hypothetical protein
MYHFGGIGGNRFKKFRIKKQQGAYYAMMRGREAGGKSIADVWKEKKHILELVGDDYITESNEHCDIGFADWDTVYVSHRFYELFKEDLEEYIEFLPIETDSGIFYIVNVLNIVDCLNEDKFLGSLGFTKVLSSVQIFEFNFDIEDLPPKVFRLPYKGNFSNGVIFFNEAIVEKMGQNKIKYNDNFNTVWSYDDPYFVDDRYHEDESVWFRLKKQQEDKISSLSKDIKN